MQPELDEAEQRRAASVVSLDLDTLRPLAVPQAGQRWDEMTVSQRRAVLSTLGIRVIINPTRRGPGIDPESVRFEWAARRPDDER